MQSISANPERLPRAVFVLTMGRSGSTLFRVMLAGAPELFCPPELNLLSYRTLRQISLRHAWGVAYAFRASQGRLIGPLKFCELYLRNASVRSVYLSLQNAIEPRILVDKSPEYGRDGSAYRRMESTFCSPQYLWLIRHPGAVVDSFYRRSALNRRLKAQSPEDAWRHVNIRIRHFLTGVAQDRWMLVRFEDLVEQPEATMEATARFLRVPYTPSLVNPFDGSSRRLLGGPTNRWLNGDPWFSGRTSIDPSLRHAWRQSATPIRLSPETLRLAEELGLSA